MFWLVLLVFRFLIACFPDCMCIDDGWLVCCFPFSWFAVSSGCCLMLVIVLVSGVLLRLWSVAFGWRCCVSGVLRLVGDVAFVG